MKKQIQSAAFTLIELLVVISIIAILAGIALPVFGQVQLRGRQTKALSNSKQIVLALKSYAVDNNGNYPVYAPGPSGSTNAPTNSNAAYANLFPDYMTDETIFWLAQSAWCNATPPNGQLDAPNTTQSLTLSAGQNEWAYVTGLSDTSSGGWPLIADGFTAGSEALPTYSSDAKTAGGVWSGKKAIVVNVDGSGSLMAIDHTTLQPLGPVGSTANANIFVYHADPNNPWLNSAAKVLNPSAPTTTQ